jgi:hypothetical protein
MSNEVVFPDKYAKVLKDLPEFKDTADAASTDDLKKIIVTCEGNIYTVEKEKDDDTKLNGAKELVKEYSAPYRDAIKVQTAKIKYALYLLEGKGEDLNNKED